VLQSSIPQLSGKNEEGGLLYMNQIVYVLIAVIAGLLAGFIVTLVSKAKLKNQKTALESERAKILEDAQNKAESIRREAVVESKDVVYQAKAEAEKELRERRSELNHLDKRLRQKEETLEKKYEQIDKREQELNKRERDYTAKERSLQDKDNAFNKLLKDQKDTLERISGLSSEEARQELLRQVEEESRFESAKLSKRIEDEARENAEKKAKEVIGFSIQRYASDYVTDSTVSSVTLPNDEMKGRIIGREGRNIRALEAATGVDLIVDDTPETVTLSAFDPVRREIARLSLERLITDGRIHPTRIEEIVEKVKKEIDAHIREEGEKAVFDFGLSGIHPELIRRIGRRKYRTS
jgi:ribonucrease Y